jgi:hypothetical protein
MNATSPAEFLTLPALSRRVGLDEDAVLARIERGQLRPDAFLRGAVPGTQPAPLFSTERLPDHVAALASPTEN